MVSFFKNFFVACITGGRTRHTVLREVITMENRSTDCNNKKQQNSENKKQQDTQNKKQQNAENKNPTNRGW